MGSGVSILKVNGSDAYERVSGTSIGGGNIPLHEIQYHK